LARKPDYVAARLRWPVEGKAATPRGALADLEASGENAARQALIYEQIGDREKRKQ